MTKGRVQFCLRALAAGTAALAVVALPVAAHDAREVAQGTERVPVEPAPEIPGAKAVIEDGLAVAPAVAPAAVKAVIRAANRIAEKPYRYGGGHRRLTDTGYDCSGSISYALRTAGLLDSSLDSSGFMRFGVPGPGTWITVRANRGHSYMVVAGLRFDTSARARGGSRWTTKMRSGRGYRARHPAGF